MFEEIDVLRNIEKGINTDISNIKISSYTLTASIMCNIKGKGLLLLNYDDVWDMYFPFYTTTINKHEFKSENLVELNKEFEDIKKQNTDTEENAKSILEKEFRKVYNLSEVSLSDPIYRKRRIKYSKSANEYRLYDMYFYSTEKITDINNVINSNYMNQVFMPLNYLEIKINGKQIVDNIAEIIGNEQVADLIAEIS